MMFHLTTRGHAIRIMLFFWRITVLFKICISVCLYTVAALEMFQNVSHIYQIQHRTFIKVTIIYIYIYYFQNPSSVIKPGSKRTNKQRAHICANLWESDMILTVNAYSHALDKMA